ncbi:restriction endonuclease subunit S [Mitsuokella sp. AF33-22]|uniref:restriction endonuclease subunit S n=1 Tax=Mitsuokella sp. AF33-22 TaxID=2292047 RepID=UPI000E54436A|nr:restriction endonuclease subunit S [Mitsuokella sp. AF33-22]RHM54846.1 restriction endonuclease subunit S [Mitsuokella sp. AF33-22]
MAKKKQEMTPEERLAAALVPGEEQPYQLPEGWKWVYLGKITTIVGGGTPSSSHPEYYDGGEVPWITPADLSNYHEVYISRGKKNITEQGLAKSSTKLMPPNTVLLSSRAPIGYVAIAENDICTNQGFKSFLPSVHFEPRYLYWFFKGNQTLLTQYASGTTFLELSARRAGEIKFPIAPISEQQRLVARIESLFAKLDAAKEKVQSVFDAHEMRKAALLHDAFAGKLTAKWRTEQGISFDVWRVEKLENLCEKITCGKTPKNDISSQGEIPYLKVYNIVNDEIDFLSKPQYIPRYVHDTKLKSSILKPNDVIMNIVGPPLRKIAIIPDTYREWNMNQAIVRFRPKDGLNYRFLYYALLNPETLDDVIQKTKGVVGQANISITQSRNLKIKLPSLSEQQEIVRILDRLLGREEQVRQSAESVLETIDRMKQSILARAFRGEL